MSRKKLFRVDYSVTFYYPENKRIVKENYMVVKANEGSDADSLLNYLWVDGSPENFCDIEDVDLDDFYNVELCTKEPVGVSAKDYCLDYDAEEYADEIEAYNKECCDNGEE
jgi:hypothetical protein